MSPRVLLLLLLALLVSVPALAEGLVVRITGASPALEARARERIAATFDRRDPGGELTLAVHGARVTARFTRAGRTLERRYALPRDTEQAAEVLQFAAENLARDEAAELVESLRPAPSGSAAPSASAAPIDSAVPGDDPAPAASSGAVSGVSDGPATAASGAASSTTPVGSAAPASSAAPARPTSTASPRAARRAESAPPRPEKWRDRPVNLAFFSPLSLARSPYDHRFAFSLGLLYDRVGAVRGAAIEGAAARYEGGFDGVSIAGLGTWSLGRDRGVAIAGLGSYTAGLASGARAVGAVDWAGERRGASFAGLWQHTVGDAAGVDVAGAVASHGGTMDGFAGAGLVTLAHGGSGLRAASVNVDGGELDGAMVGVVNVGGRVNGAMVGLVNVADHVPAPIGFVNVVRDGRLQPVLAWRAPSAGLIGLRSEVRWMSSQIAVRYGTLSGTPSDLGLELSLGPQIRDVAELQLGYSSDHETRVGLFHQERHVVFARVAAVPPMVGPVGITAGLGARRAVSGPGAIPEGDFTLDAFLGARFF